MCRLLDDITDKFVPLIQSVELEVDSIDDLVLVLSGTERSDMLRRVSNARKRVMNLQRLLSAKADVIRVLVKRLEGGLGVPSDNLQSTARDTCLYLGDVQDRNSSL